MAHASGPERSRGVVVLDLPKELGGSREYDGRQIDQLADVVSVNGDLPTREEIAWCQSHYPQYSRSYTEYGKLLEEIGKDVKSFLALARELRSVGNR